MKHLKLRSIKFLVLLTLCFLALLVFIKLSNSFEDTHFIPIVTIEQLHNISNGIVYFGRDSCNVCLMFEPLLLDVLSNNNIKIYYFDIDYFRHEINIDENELKDIFDIYQVETIPTLISFKDNILDDIYVIDFTYDDSLDREGSIISGIENFFLLNTTVNEYSVSYPFFYDIVIVVSFILSIVAMVYSRMLKIKKQSFFLCVFNLIIMLLLTITLYSMIDFEYNRIHTFNGLIFIILLITYMLNGISIFITININLIEKIKKLFMPSKS